VIFTSETIEEPFRGVVSDHRKACIVRCNNSFVNRFCNHFDELAIAITRVTKLRVGVYTHQVFLSIIPFDELGHVVLFNHRYQSAISVEGGLVFYGFATIVVAVKVCILFILGGITTRTLVKGGHCNIGNIVIYNMRINPRLNMRMIPVVKRHRISNFF